MLAIHVIIKDMMNNNVEYKLLSYQFLLLTIWGIWFQKNWLKNIIALYTCFFVLEYILNFLICTEMFVNFYKSIGMPEFKLSSFFVR